jgi:hypothetical protein
VDSAALGGGQIDLVGQRAGKEVANSGLIGAIKCGVVSADDPLGRMALRQQLPDDRRADHSAVAGKMDFWPGDTSAHDLGLAGVEFFLWRHACSVVKLCRIG